MATNDGGSAFPGFQHFIAPSDDWSHGTGKPIQVVTGQPHGGMSLRDYFAAAALSELVRAFMRQNSAWDDYNDLAASAFLLADAMLRAREAKSPREAQDAHIADWGRK